MNALTTLGRPALALLGLGLLGLAGCQPDIEGPTTASAGNASFARYIAVGNSLTSGYADDGLYREGQLNSYPLILSRQFALAGGGQFRQPLFTEAQASGSGYLRLAAVTAAGPVTQRVPGTAGRITPTAAPYTKYLDGVDNFGVPGIRLADVQTANLGNLSASRPNGFAADNFNPYFERITPDGNSQSYFQRLKAEVGTAAAPAANTPTFFSFWLGNNDVLGYATSGGALTTPPYSITNTDTFRLKATRMVSLLTAAGARGVISNIPDVTGIPFFTTVGPAIRTALAANNIPTAAPFVYTTGALAPVVGAPNTRVTRTLGDIRANGSGTLLLTLTAAPYASLYGQPTGKYWRDFFMQATGTTPRANPLVFAGFLAVLAVDTTKAFGASTGNPFPSTLVLDDTEQTAVSNATTSYNNSLLAIATARGLAYFDANVYFRSIAATGIATNGVNNTASFISGNLFSLDGVHPTPRGYALVANELLRAINSRYGASVPLVDANEYRGVPLP